MKVLSRTLNQLVVKHGSMIDSRGEPSTIARHGGSEVGRKLARCREKITILSSYTLHKCTSASLTASPSPRFEAIVLQGKRDEYTGRYELLHVDASKAVLAVKWHFHGHTTARQVIV